MEKNDLMLIESPNKIRSISKCLKNSNINIMATYGHLRELSKWGLGFNTKTYEIRWVNVKNKVRINNKEVDLIDAINDAAEKSRRIYLSTDPDREGEAISWHIYSILNVLNKKKCLRVIFNEITEPAIKEALKNPQSLNQNQINSYLARRLLDRALGFKLSAFTYKRVGGISAGRVQSIALKFLKDKELEIQKFVPSHWFNVDITLKNGLSINLKTLSPQLTNIQIREDIKGESINFLTKEDAEEFIKSLSPKYKLIEISEPKKEIQKSFFALKTSTMHEYAISRLNMRARQVEQVSQRLYEGLEIDGESISLITYPRTDRTDLSSTFVNSARRFISEKYSDRYFNKFPRKIKTKNDSLVQGAHEGIRPTDITLTPDIIKPFVKKEEYNLYRLIWVYAVSSLMSDAVYESIQYKFENNGNIFVANFRRQLFYGYRMLFNQYLSDIYRYEKSIFFPKNLELNKLYDIKKLDIVKVDKKPPYPYTEATLIKSLEDKGIGRPSTYAVIANVVLNRNYASRSQQKLKITDLGMKVAQTLEENFPDIMNYDYTRNMEKELDNISENKTNWQDFLTSVFVAFDKELQNAESKMPKKDLEKVGRNCSQCGSELVYRFSRKTNVKFISCSGYPECNYSESINNYIELDKNCPKCSKKLVKKPSKWNGFFISCSGYPECNYSESLNEKELLEEKCPKCGKQLVKRKNRWNRFFISCSGYPECKYLKNVKLDKSEKTSVQEDDILNLNE